MLASIGLAEVKVYRRLKLAILSTGDEIVEPGQADCIISTGGVSVGEEDQVKTCVENLHTNQSSGALSAASWSNGFAIQPIDQLIANGDSIKFIPS